MHSEVVVLSLLLLPLRLPLPLYLVLGTILYHVVGT